MVAPALLAGLLLLSGAAAAPTTVVPVPSPSSLSTNDTASLLSAATATQEPCARASSAWASFRGANPPGTVPTIAPELAQACLASVPLDKAAALALVDAIEPYLDWQSDAAYKAAPPPDYYSPAYDMYAALADVRATLVADGYAGEWAFQYDLYARVFAPGHDGHLAFYPDLLSRAFDYGHGVSLVSISDDAAGGVPQIKFLEDVKANAAAAPAVVRINGEPAEQHIQQAVDRFTFNQDPDAAYNTMFYSRALAAASGGQGCWAGGCRSRFAYPGSSTNYTFSNGSTVTVANVAYVRGSLADITDGASMFRKFCSGALPEADAEQSTAAVVGYPEPVFSTEDGQASCYFLEGAGYEDVAVLALLSFEPLVPAAFQNAVRLCLARAAQSGRRRLVLDVSANGGGYILLGYDLFRQLFPAVQEDGISRWRENGGFLGISEVVSALSATVDPATTDNGFAVNLYQSTFNSKFDLDVDNKPFASFAAKFDAHVHQDTNYTANMRWNLDDPLVTYNTSFGIGIAISGYGPLANMSAPAIDEVVLLYDGFCASTCTIASEMLRLQGGVRSIALGGRPSVAGQPIQGVGGVKGSQVLTFTNIRFFTQLAEAYLQTGVHIENAAAVKAALARYSDLPIRRSSAASVNVRDQILRPNLDDGLPAQYVREDADCRLYYTADMVNDITATWRAAAKAAWGGGACAAGSVPRPSSNPLNRTSTVKRDDNYEKTASANINAVFQAQADKAFRPKDLPKAERERFMATFNQKLIV